MISPKGHLIKHVFCQQTFSPRELSATRISSPFQRTRERRPRPWSQRISLARCEYLGFTRSIWRDGVDDLTCIAATEHTQPRFRESMFVRNQPGVWGALQAFDPAAKHIVDSGWDTPFNYIEKHASTPSVEELARKRISELGNDYNARIKADWETFVKNA